MSARALLAAVASTLLTLGLGAAAASALDDPPADGLSCSYDPTTRSLTVIVGMGVDEGGQVVRIGDGIAVTQEDVTITRTRKGKFRQHSTVERVDCAGTSTISNTDAIRVVMDTDEDTDFRISLAGGPFAPGATPEGDGSSEIEISVEHLAPGLTVGFIGGAGPDSFRFGSRGGVSGVNLNAQDEASSPDVDATLQVDPPSDPRDANADWPVLEAFTEAGDDAVTSAGGPEFDAGFSGAYFANGGPGNDSLIATTRRFTAIKGAGGNDLIQGQGLRNVVFGGGGDDTITTGPYGDDIEPGKGNDVVFAGGGKDIAAMADHMRDRISCGGGRDAVAKDRKDKTPGCEHKVFRIVHLKPFDD